MYYFNYKTWTPFCTVLVFFIASFVITSQLNNPLSFETEHSLNLSLKNNYSSILEFTSGCPQQDHSTPEDNELGQHHCCASICLLKVPCGQSITVKRDPSITLALIMEDVEDKAVVRSKTVFRPPIA